MKEAIKKQIAAWELNFMDLDLLAVIIHAVVLIIICLLVYWLTRKIILDRIHKLAKKSKSQWDDKLMDAHFFKRVILLLPLLIIRYSVDAVLADYDASIPLITKLFELKMRSVIDDMEVLNLTPNIFLLAVTDKRLGPFLMSWFVDNLSRLHNYIVKQFNKELNLQMKA